MKRKIKKILSYLPSSILDYFEWIFSDAAENHIRVTKLKKNKFHSYTQLKKHQKRIKLLAVGFFLAIFFLLIGLVFGPILFPPQIESELYIPNGKGDILLGNISKNQATVVFKTLDSANDNNPLATRAYVEVFSDENFLNLVRRSTIDDYAITHIIPLDALQENNIYYIRITATDATSQNHTKSVSFWGDGKDPIKFYTTGELIPNCALDNASQELALLRNRNNELAEKNERNAAPIAQSLEDINGDDADRSADSVLYILNVMNENYLQPKNKVQTIISWNTNRPATSVLIYGEGNSKEKKEVVIEEKMQTRHAAVLTTLKSATTYYFQTKSMDKDGNIAISQEYSLRTPKPQSSVIDQIATSFKTIFQQIKPN
jgi:hypothetical protein